MRHRRVTPVALRAFAFALGLVVAAAALVPVMATAGPADRPAPAALGGGSPAVLAAPESPAPDQPVPSAPAQPPAPETPVVLEVFAPEPGPDPDPDPDIAPAPLPVVTRCGPELSSPDGVEAQTCVVSEGTGVRARTYYRNATGRELDAVLTFLAPAGRTVQVRCAIEARDEPGTCQTPMEPREESRAAEYSAVAEFAGSGEGDSTPLLLRSGSNGARTEGS
ncbi:hypothetical protein ABZ990_08610 [Streptomyces sp. NPDC046203]|uniref:hypothetical protein n=1 Tax=Streptomyces sp. NPDC046203 TaxID=3154602 RepID=UPI0033CA7EEE